MWRETNGESPDIRLPSFLGEKVQPNRYNYFYTGNICEIDCNPLSLPKELVYTGDAEPADDLPYGVVKNSPNPFTNSTKILFILPENDHVSVDVFDISGKYVTNLFTGDVNKNQEYTVEFNGSDLPSGLYIYKMTANDKVVTGKMMLMKENE